MAMKAASAAETARFRRIHFVRRYFSDFALAAGNLLSQKTRTLLTALGIIFGVGAVIGGIVVASRRPTGLRAVTIAAGAFGVTMLAAALAPTFAIELATLACVGAASVSFMARGNTTLQLTAQDAMRGRVMALWSVTFIGTTPIGGPVIGYVSEHAGPRWGLAVGGLAALVATTLAIYPYFRRTALRHPPAAGSDQLPPGAGPS